MLKLQSRVLGVQTFFQFVNNVDLISLVYQFVFGQQLEQLKNANCAVLEKQEIRISAQFLEQPLVGVSGEGGEFSFHVEGDNGRHAVN